MDYQKSSKKTWYIIGIVIIVALAFWYFSTKSSSTTTGPTTAGQTQTSVANNSVSAISSDLNQIPDDTAALSQAASTSAAAVSSF